MNADTIVLTAVSVLFLFYVWVAARMAWSERPTVCWDERRGCWRSARLVQYERSGVWPRP